MFFGKLEEKDTLKVQKNENDIAETFDLNTPSLKNVVTKLVVSGLTNKNDFDWLKGYAKQFPNLKDIFLKKEEIRCVNYLFWMGEDDCDLVLNVTDVDADEHGNDEFTGEISELDVVRLLKIKKITYYFSISYLYNNTGHLERKFRNNCLFIYCTDLVLDIGFWTFKNIKIQTFCCFVSILQSCKNKHSLTIESDVGMKEPEDEFEVPSKERMNRILSTWNQLQCLSIYQGFICPRKETLLDLIEGIAHKQNIKCLSLNYNYMDDDFISVIGKVCIKQFTNLRILRLNGKNLDSSSASSILTGLPTTINTLSFMECGNNFFSNCIQILGKGELPPNIKTFHLQLSSDLTSKLYDDNVVYEQIRNKYTKILFNYEQEDNAKCIKEIMVSNNEQLVVKNKWTIEDVIQREYDLLATQNNS